MMNAGIPTLPDERSGGVTLLAEAHHGTENHYGFPIVGWKPTSQGDGLFNPRGFGMQRVVVQQRAAGVGQDSDVRLRPIYDQPMIAENLGTVLVALREGKVGMVQAWRNTCERVGEPTADYVGGLDESRRWEELMLAAGGWKWELVAGIPPQKVSEPFASWEELALLTARHEGLSEAGFSLDNPEVVGRVNWNPTFSLHDQFVVRADVVGVGAAAHEELEVIGDVHFFTPTQVRHLVIDGLFTNALHKGALADADFHY